MKKKLAEAAFGKRHGKKIHPHLFRHHMGYIMMESEGGGITNVQAQLGHSNIAYSAVYSQPEQEEQKKIMDKNPILS